jgi:hypothetical protein
MSMQDAYEAWAPAASQWSKWAKPVLFAAMREQQAKAGQPELGGANLDWLPAGDPTTFYVLDLPGAEGVVVGLDLAAKGVRPVPLYNALPAPAVGSRAVSERQPVAVDVETIVGALRRGATVLRDLTIAPTAPPAFLLDWNRNSNAAARKPSYFDNRSISFASDFPSADYLRSAGLTRAVLVQRVTSAVHSDLSQTLWQWHQGGLRVQLKRLDLETAPVDLPVKKPSRVQKVWLLVKAYLLKSKTGFGVSVTRGSGG